MKRWLALLLLVGDVRVGPAIGTAFAPLSGMIAGTNGPMNYTDSAPGARRSYKVKVTAP